MKWITIIYDTICLRLHPVWYEEDGGAITWRACWETARIIHS